MILDRCHQARVVTALEPEWEARFEPKSYGFRPGRGCHDAIEAIYQVVKGKRPRRLWALDADLASAFDLSSPTTTSSSARHVPRSGNDPRVVEGGRGRARRLHRTEDGVPQGGVVSPLLLNIALHGMETGRRGPLRPDRQSAGKAARARRSCQVRRRSGAPRGAIRPGGDERTPPWVCRSRL